jgi:hypothetical protein
MSLSSSPSPMRSRALVLRGRLARRLRALRWLRNTQIRNARLQRARSDVLDDPTAQAIYHVETAMAALTRLAHSGLTRGQARIA